MLPGWDGGEGEEVFVSAILGGNDIIRAEGKNYNKYLHHEKNFCFFHLFK